MRTILILTFLVLTITAKASKQDSIVNRIFKLAYNQEYEEAAILLNSNKSEIDKFYFAVLDIDMSYWKNVTGTEKPKYEVFEKTLEKYNTLSVETFNQKGIQLIQLSYQLRYELKRFKLIDAVFTHKKTKVLFEELKNNQQMQSIRDPKLVQLYSSMFLYFSNYINPFRGESNKENCKRSLSTMEIFRNRKALLQKLWLAIFWAEHI